MTDPLLDEDMLRSASALEAEFGALFTTFRRIVADNAQRLSPGMLPGTYKVFTTVVTSGPLSSSALAELLQADKGQISRTVRELESLGLVQRTPDPHDGRSSLLSATEDGVARLAEARRPTEGRMAQTLASWSREDVDTLTRLLRALNEGRAPHDVDAPDSGAEGVAAR